jgi:hypothetical protein
MDLAFWLERVKRRDHPEDMWVDNFKMDCREMRWKVVDWMGSRGLG